MSSFTVRSLVVNNNTVSVSTSTGAIICAGGINISGNINVGGNMVVGSVISGSSLSASNTLRLWDGVNFGGISQLGTNLTLSSSGNTIVIPENHTLEFKGDNTTQITAYDGYGIVDECDTHTYIYNRQNPSTPKYILSATFALNQTIPGATNLVAQAGFIYFYPIRLVKGQVVTGGGVYFAASGSPQVGYSLYRTYDSSYVRVAQTSTITNVVTSGMNYLNYSASYTVPVTGIYYTTLYVNSVGSSLGIISSNFNSGTDYTNYNYPAIARVLNLVALRVAIAGGPPATLASVTPTSYTRPAYFVVYTS